MTNFMNLEILYDCTNVFITFVGFCQPRYEVINWSYNSLTRFRANTIFLKLVTHVTIAWSVLELI